MTGIPVNNIGGNMMSGDIGGTKSLNSEPGSGFDTVITEAMNKVSQVQNEADKAVNELASGGDITNAILAVEKADMTFQVMVEVRNKLLKTYEEVMRMQV